MPARNERFKNLLKQELMIGGQNFDVHAKVVVTEIRAAISQKHAIGAQRDHLQTMGVRSKTCRVEGFTTVPFRESGLWTIEMYQRAGLPIPFVSNSFTSLVYIKRFNYREEAERFKAIKFEIDMVEARPIASLIGGIVHRLAGSNLKEYLEDSTIKIGVGAIAGAFMGE
jgi:hypothetical protein